MLWQMPGAHETQAVQETIRRSLLRFYLNPNDTEKGATIPFLDNSHRHRDSPRANANYWHILHFNRLMPLWEWWKADVISITQKEIAKFYSIRLIDMLPTFQLSDFLCAIMGKSFHPQNKSEKSEFDASQCHLRSLFKLNMNIKSI